MDYFTIGLIGAAIVIIWGALTLKEGEERLNQRMQESHRENYINSMTAQSDRDQVTSKIKMLKLKFDMYHDSGQFEAAKESLKEIERLSKRPYCECKSSEGQHLTVTMQGAVCSSCFKKVNFSYPDSIWPKNNPELRK